MEFEVEFYESALSRIPVQEFLDDLKKTDPDDFAAVLAGLAKLRNRQYQIRTKAHKIAAHDLKAAKDRKRDWIARKRE
jgi:hypothetical protein